MRLSILIALLVVIFGFPIFILINTAVETKVHYNTPLCLFDSQGEDLLKVEMLDCASTSQWRTITFISTNLACTSLVKPVVTESNGFWIIKIKIEEKKK
jgi:hypothetical protein